MKKKKDIAEIDSGIKGMLLVVKKGYERIKISLSAVNKFFSLIKEHRQTEKKEEQAKTLKSDLKEKIVDIVQANPGLIGLETEKDHLRTSVFESVSVETSYNRDLLKKSLEEAYPSLVAEDFRLTILLTPDYPREELIQFLKKFFGKEEIYKKLVSEETELRVDEQKLEGLISQGNIKLLPGARTIDESRSWNIKTTLVKK